MSIHTALGNSGTAGLRCSLPSLWLGTGQPFGTGPGRHHSVSDVEQELPMDVPSPACCWQSPGDTSSAAFLAFAIIPAPCIPQILPATKGK